MRSLLLVSLTLLSACSGSGFYRYERDTFTLPGAQPNRPTGTAANFTQVVHDDVQKPVVLAANADAIWPPPPTGVPTLKDLQTRAIAANKANGGATPENLPPLPQLPSLPGYEISPPEPSRVPPPSTFVAGHVRIPLGGVVPTNVVPPAAQQGADGTVVVPNGNGTSTVISPTGAISTIPTPKQ